MERGPDVSFLTGEKMSMDLSENKTPTVLLAEVREMLSRVYHDVNNPLAIISGNAQFLLELSRVMDLDDDLLQPIQDIDEASNRVAVSLRELATLKEYIAGYLSSTDVVTDLE